MLWNAQGLALSTFQVVLVPTIAGVTLNELFPSAVKKFTRVLPLIGVVLTTLLCASPVGQVSGVLKCALPEMCRILLLLQQKSREPHGRRSSTAHTCQRSVPLAPRIAPTSRAHACVHRAAVVLAAIYKRATQQ